MDLSKRARELRSDAQRHVAHAKKLTATADRLKRAADVLEGKDAKPRRKPTRKAQWNVHEAARMRADGKTWAEVEAHFRTGLTQTGLAMRLKKAGYGPEERSLPERVHEQDASNGHRDEAVMPLA